MNEKVEGSEGLRICQVAILQEASGRTEPFLDRVCQPLRTRVKGVEGVDITRGEAVEADLTRLIEKRDEKRRQSEGERLEKELYEPSVKAYRERQEAQRRAAWRAFHEGQAARHRATLETLATYHEREAAKLQLEGAAVEGEGG